MCNDQEVNTLKEKVKKLEEKVSYNNARIVSSCVGAIVAFIIIVIVININHSDLWKQANKDRRNFDTECMKLDDKIRDASEHTYQMIKIVSATTGRIAASDPNIDEFVYLLTASCDYYKALNEDPEASYYAKRSALEALETLVRNKRESMKDPNVNGGL